MFCVLKYKTIIQFKYSTIIIQKNYNQDPFGLVLTAKGVKWLLSKSIKMTRFLIMVAQHYVIDQNTQILNKRGNNRNKFNKVIYIYIYIYRTE